MGPKEEDRCPSLPLPFPKLAFRVPARVAPPLPSTPPPPSPPTASSTPAPARPRTAPPVPRPAPSPVLPTAPVPAGPPSGSHTRTRAGASGPLVPRVPARRRALEGLERTRPPWSRSSLPGPREMSGQLSCPRVATRSLVRNKQILLGSQAPDIHSGGTLPSHHSPIISPQLWKKQPSFLFRKGPVFSLQLPSTWAPAGPQSVGKHYPPFSPQGGSSARISPATNQERPRRRGGLSGCSWALAILRGGGAAAAAMRRTKGRGRCGRGRGRGSRVSSARAAASAAP